MITDPLIVSGEELAVFASFLAPPAHLAFAAPELGRDAADRATASLVARGILEIVDDALVPDDRVALMLAIAEQATEMVALTSEWIDGSAWRTERLAWLSDGEFSLQHADLGPGLIGLAIVGPSAGASTVSELAVATTALDVDPREVTVALDTWNHALSTRRRGGALDPELPELVTNALAAMAGRPVIRTVERRATAGTDTHVSTFEWIDAEADGAWSIRPDQAANRAVIQAFAGPGLEAQVQALLDPTSVARGA